MLTLISVQVRFTGTLTADGETSAVKGSLEFCRAYAIGSEAIDTSQAYSGVQLGPRSTGQSATGHPLSLVILAGRLYPSTNETEE